MDAMTRGLLAAGHSVKIFAASTEKHPWTPQLVEEKWLEQTQPESVFIDTRINRVDAFSSIVTGDSYNISRFFSPDMESQLTQLLRKRVFDLVIFESLFTAPYLRTVRRYSDAPCVLRTHNVEHRIWQKLASETTGLTRRTYLQWLAARLETYENSTVNDFDSLAPISYDDAKHFRALGCTLPMHVVPFGLDASEFPAITPSIPQHVFHLGAMDWRPNQQGVQWFCNLVWPLIRMRHPEAILKLAGRHFPEDWVIPPGLGIEVLGEVPNAWTMMTDSGIMIVPLLSGSGMRIKAIEGMAAGRPIVSTPLGLEGIPGEDRVHFRVAKEPEEFAAAVIELLEDGHAAMELGARARAWVMEHYDNAKLVQSLVNALQEAHSL